MPSLHPGYEYDIFISYRQNDDHSGWVTEFVHQLTRELAATIKEPVSVYFDSNPSDGILETHAVGESLQPKVRSLIFIPILSRTYCDVKSFAWKSEFLVFRQLSLNDKIGTNVKLTNGNVASRILPIRIHDLDIRDQKLFETESGGPLRPIDFIFQGRGVNRPLTAQDSRSDNLSKALYVDQINKAANAIGQILEVIAENNRTAATTQPSTAQVTQVAEHNTLSWVWRELIRRNVLKAALVYILVSLLFRQLLIFLTPNLRIEQRVFDLVYWILLAGLGIAISFAWFYELSPKGLIRSSSKQSEANPFPPYRKKPLTSWSFMSLLVVALVLQYAYVTYQSAANHPVSTGNSTISVAVLPFTNRSGDLRDGYIADGITDDIINRLAIVSKLRVISRGRTQQYQANLLPLDEIANNLDVSILLTGSVDRQGDKIAIRVQMVDATNTFLWGDTFQRTTENIVAVQSELAQVISDQLRIELNDQEKQRLHQHPTENATAYDYYLRGRSLYYKYRSAANDSAIDQFKLAIELDPNYARAWAGLGDAYSQMNMRYGRGQSWLDSSQIAGERAIQLDSNLSEAYKALANSFSYQDQYDKAYPLLVKSVELSPTNEQAVGNLGTNFLLRGDLPTALQWQKKAVGMNPKNWVPYQLIGWTYRLLGDLENAELWLRKSLELNPGVYDTYELLAYTYVAQGRNREALDLVPSVLGIGEDSRALEVAGLISHFAGDVNGAKKYFQKSIDIHPSYKDDPNFVGHIGLAQILLEEGKKVDADVYLSHALNMNLEEVKKGSESGEPRLCIATVKAIRGNRKEALNWLQKAIDLNWVDYAQLVYGPYFVKFRNDPAFLEKINFIRAKTDAMRKKAETN